MNNDRAAGVTLIEIMIGLAVVIVLASVTLAVTTNTMDGAYTAREIAAGRVLGAAYAAAAADNDGYLLPGFDDQAEGYTSGGLAVSAAAAHRYPFRLAPYFDYGLEGVILVNRNKLQIAQAGLADGDYGPSLYPALGMNVSYVGGTYEGGVLDMPNECLTRMGQVTKASAMLVFASAGHGTGDKKVDGFHKLEPPNKRVKVWDSTEDADDARDKPPGNYGNIDFRHNGRAVCVFLDGSVRSLTPRELRDMRLWNRNAQDANDPNYHVTAEAPPPGRGGGR